MPGGEDGVAFVGAGGAGFSGLPPRAMAPAVPRRGLRVCLGDQARKQRAGFPPAQTRWAGAAG